MPVRDERHLFELLILEGAQAGLSWSTILRKREGYRRAFAGFDSRPWPRTATRTRPACSAMRASCATGRRSRAAIGNARATLALHEAGTTLVDHLWSFVDGTPIVNRFETLAEIPAETDASRAMSRDLPRRGFKFVGPDDLLRADAVRGPGERPRDRLLPLGGGPGPA